MYHLESVTTAQALKVSTEDTSRRIDVITNTSLQRQIDNNKHILEQIVHAILFLGKQGLAFRGDNEDVKSPKNPGNFLALLKN